MCCLPDYDFSFQNQEEFQCNDQEQLSIERCNRVSALNFIFSEAWNAGAPCVIAFVSHRNHSTLRKSVILTLPSKATGRVPIAPFFDTATSIDIHALRALCCSCDNQRRGTWISTKLKRSNFSENDCGILGLCFTPAALSARPKRRLFKV